MKVLWQNESNEAFTALFRLELEVRLPRHRHKAVEQTFALQDSLTDDEVVCTAEYLSRGRPGSVHAAQSPDGCLTIGIFRYAYEFLPEKNRCE